MRLEPTTTQSRDKHSALLPEDSDCIYIYDKYIYHIWAYPYQLTLENSNLTTKKHN